MHHLYVLWPALELTQPPALNQIRARTTHYTGGGSMKN